MATRGRTRSASRGKVKTTAETNIDWIEEHCVIPEGRDVGKPVKLRDWQKADLRKIYDNPAGTRMAILSFGKKNAKTSLAAFLLLLHLAGPEARANTQLPSTAQSKEQAAVLFKLAAKIVRMSPTLSPVIVIRDTIKELLCPELGTLYKALSADASTAHGMSPIFAVHDELGQVKGPVSELFNAIENAMGAHENPMSIVISTQAPTDADLLSVLIDDALTGRDPRVVLSLYTADLKLDPFSEEAIRQANPAFGDFLNATEVLDQAEKARRMPSQESLYRNYTLNQRVEVNSPFIARERWQLCTGELAETFDGLPVYAGLDLSATADLTALVLIAPVSGKWHVKPTFWLPGEGLREKSQHDRVPYDLWQRQGFLQTTPGSSVEYDFVAEYLYRLFDDLDIRRVGFDDWNWRHLKPCLVRAGLQEDVIEGRFQAIRQNYKEMSPALRSLESAVFERKLVHDGHVVMNMCIANAVVVADGKENRMLTKAKSRGRIDGVVALALAMSVAGTYEEVAKVDIDDFLAHAVVA